MIYVQNTKGEIEVSVNNEASIRTNKTSFKEKLIKIQKVKFEVSNNSTTIGNIVKVGSPQIFLSVSDAAKELGVSTSMIRAYIDTPKILNDYMIFSQAITKSK